MSMSGSGDESQALEGTLPEKPTLREILLYSKAADGQDLKAEDRRKAIGKFAYGLPQIMEAKDERDFSENLIDALKSVLLPSDSKQKLTENQQTIAHENIGLLFEELYRNQCISQGDFHAICLRYHNLLPENKQEEFLQRMDAVDKMFQAILKKDKQKESVNAPLNENKDEAVRQTAEAIRAHTIYLFSKLTPMDFYGQKWAKKKGTPLNEIAEFFNQTSRHVASDILNQGSVKAVEERAVFWGNVLNHALDTKDYNTAMTILSAFNSTSVKLLNISSLEDFAGRKKLEETLARANMILSNEKNFSNYKQALKDDLDLNQSSIPYFGVYMTEYTFIDDGNPSMTGGKYNYGKGSLLSTLFASVVDLQTKSNKESYRYQYHGDLISSIQEGVADEATLDVQRNLIRLDRTKRDYSTVDTFLSNMLRKHYKTETDTFELPLYISIRVKKSEKDADELPLLNDVSSHKFIQGELAYQLAKVREKKPDIAPKNMLNMIDALIKNAQTRGLSKEIMNDYASLREVVSNRIQGKHVQLKEDEVVLMALKHSIVHDLPEQEDIKRKIVNHSDRDGTIKASVKERVSVINKRLDEIRKELKSIKSKLERIDPSNEEYKEKIKKLEQLKQESSNYFHNLNSIKQTYLRKDSFLSETIQFKDWVESGIELSTKIMEQSSKMLSEAGRTVLLANPPSEPEPSPPTESSPPPSIELNSQSSTLEYDLDDNEEPDLSFGESEEEKKVASDSILPLELTASEKAADTTSSTPSNGSPSVEITTPQPKSPSLPRQAFAAIDRYLNPYPEVKAEVKAIKQAYDSIEEKVKNQAKDPEINKNSRVKFIYTDDDINALKRLQDRLSVLKERNPDGYHLYASDFGTIVALNIRDLSRHKDFKEEMGKIKSHQDSVRDSVHELQACQAQFDSILKRVGANYADLASYQELVTLKSKLEDLSEKFKDPSISSERKEQVAKLANNTMMALEKIEGNSALSDQKCALLQKVTQELEKDVHTKVEGIFRISAESKKVESAFKKIIRDSSSAFPETEHEIVGVFKKILDAPPPLMTKEEGKKLFEELHQKDADAKICIQNAVREIKEKDPVRGDTLEKVLKLFDKVVENYNQNKMDGYNVMTGALVAERVFNMPRYEGVDPRGAANHFNSVNKLIGSAIDAGLTRVQEVVEQVKKTRLSRSKSESDLSSSLATESNLSTTPTRSRSSSIDSTSRVGSVGSEASSRSTTPKPGGDKSDLTRSQSMSDLSDTKKRRP